MVAFAEFAQTSRVIAGAAEADEHRQALGEFGQMIGQPFQRSDRPGRRFGGVATDEDHEQRNQRQADRDDDGGEHIGEDDPHEQDDGHHGRRAQCRQHRGEIVVEVVDAAGDGHGRRGSRPTATAQQCGQDPRPQPLFGFGGQSGAQTAVEPESATAQSGAEEAEDDPHARTAVADDRPNHRLGDENDPHRAGQSGEDGQPQPPPTGRQFEQNRQR